MLAASWKKNDRKAYVLIFAFSFFVFVLVSATARMKLNWHLRFDPHIFALANAVINSFVAVLLLSGLVAVKNKKYALHKKIMLTALFLSVIFLVSYVCHHLLAGEARFGDMNHDGILDPSEKMAAGSQRFVYYFILGTHIPLAGLVLPFILFTVYRALIGEYDKHRKLVRITWPLWFYVAVTGIIVYFMIRPYYH